VSQSRCSSKGIESKMSFNLCVFCGSQPGKDPAFKGMATALGRAMAEAEVRLVFGGGSIGLMGAVSDSVLSSGGQATGVIPEFLSGREIRHQSAEMIVVPDMHIRKRTMFERSDAFCVLPGGIGTLEEFFEMITWRQLSVHNKPVILANWNDYWGPLIAMANGVRDGGFAYGPMTELFTVVDEVADILPTLGRELENIASISGPGHPNLTET
jgi:uncharacterized protein (TIGR00730 family)